MRARAALALLGGSGTLILAHVTPRVRVPLGEPQPWKILYGNGVRSLFDVLERGLAAPSGVTVERASLDGDPARALLALAADRGVDLIAAGSHGYSALTAPCSSRRRSSAR